MYTIFSTSLKQIRSQLLLQILFSFLLFSCNNTTPAEESAFSHTGVVEGFYGRQWTHTERLDMIRFMGEVGLKDYFYAPKDDPLHRGRWRERYSGDALDRFNEYFDLAQKSGVNLWYTISPGLTIEYASSADYDSLLVKIDDMHALGIRHFGLFLDDVPETLQHEGDVGRFANLAEAHVHLINRLHADLSTRDSELIVCPTTYTGAWGDREYVEILGMGIPEEIPLFWTGNDVAVATITGDDALEWGDLMNRKPLVWDNYPVNDFDTWRLFLGPLTGRASDLPETTSGLIANPMNQPYASMISLYTVADYTFNPHSYIPAVSLHNALTNLYPVEAVPHLYMIVDLFNDYPWEYNIFSPLYTPGIIPQLDELTPALDRWAASIDSLKRLPGDIRTPRLNGFINELDILYTYTRNNLNAMRQDPAYIEANGLLVYRDELDRFGEHETRAARWQTGNHGYNPPKVDLEFDGHLITFTFTLDDKSEWQSADLPVNGDHFIISLLDNAPTGDTWLTDRDVLLIVYPDQESGELVYELKVPDLTPFSRMGGSDIHLYSFTPFFYEFTRPAAEVIYDLPEVRVFQPGETAANTVKIAVYWPDRIVERLNIGGLLTLDDTRDRFIFSHRPNFGNRNAYLFLTRTEYAN
ncbi:MAG: beta-N-acetylglucosaminidase domain-containing protein [Rhodothermaceae bacterium]|nr:beta-N-acetylglucosaminidase domain-containing protein [Rhodothermaceae bacterium]